MNKILMTFDERDWKILQKLKKNIGLKWEHFIMELAINYEGKLNE